MIAIFATLVSRVRCAPLPIPDDYLNHGIEVLGDEFVRYKDDGDGTILRILPDKETRAIFDQVVGEREASTSSAMNSLGAAVEERLEHFKHIDEYRRRLEIGALENNLSGDEWKKIVDPKLKNSGKKAVAVVLIAWADEAANARRAEFLLNGPRVMDVMLNHTDPACAHGGGYFTTNDLPGAASVEGEIRSRSIATLCKAMSAGQYEIYFHVHPNVIILPGSAEPSMSHFNNANERKFVLEKFRIQAAGSLDSKNIVNPWTGQTHTWLGTTRSIVFVHEHLKLGDTDFATFQSTISPALPGPGANYSQFVLQNMFASRCLNTSTSCDKVVTQVGLMLHELGHLLWKLPDIYDTTYKSWGVGHHDLMGYPYGPSLANEAHPSCREELKYLPNQAKRPALLNLMSRAQLGWAVPYLMELTQGTITVNNSYGGASFSDGCLNPDYVIPPAVIRHDPFFRFNGSELYMIELRRSTPLEPCVPGDSLNNGGIALWHIDSSNANTDSSFYPGKDFWPEKHGRIVLIQADGRFDLEKAVNLGTGSDYFRGNQEFDYSYFDSLTTQLNNPLKMLSSYESLRNWELGTPTELDADARAWSVTDLGDRITVNLISNVTTQPVFPIQGILPEDDEFCNLEASKLYNDPLYHDDCHRLGMHVGSNDPTCTVDCAIAISANVGQRCLRKIGKAACKRALPVATCDSYLQLDAASNREFGWCKKECDFILNSAEKIETCKKLTNSPDPTKNQFAKAACVSFMNQGDCSLKSGCTWNALKTTNDLNCIYGNHGRDVDAFTCEEFFPTDAWCGTQCVTFADGSWDAWCSWKFETLGLSHLPPPSRSNYSTALCMDLGYEAYGYPYCALPNQCLVDETTCRAATAPIKALPAQVPAKINCEHYWVNVDPCVKHCAWYRSGSWDSRCSGLNPTLPKASLNEYSAASCISKSQKADGYVSCRLSAACERDPAACTYYTVIT